MADIALSAAQTLFAALECTVLKEVCSGWGYKEELEDLKRSVSTIHKVLLDAETHKEISHEARDYIEKLKDAVYDADDLFDEVRTLAELRQVDKGNKLSTKVRSFFSSKKNPLSIAYTTSKEVKRIKKSLEAIASDHSKYGFQINSAPIRQRREETCSYVYKPDIIGRENDKKDVIDRLLDCEAQNDVGFITIVGVGGLGKTALAQLVYDDERIKHEFSSRLWACVSDQDGQKFDAKVILSKILDAAGRKPDIGSSKERVQNEFQEKFGGKKCFLVLDDVWNESRYEWGELKGFLMKFGRGSRIVVTTRSKATARIIGDGDTHTYELRGLSEENSWHLFELAAFGNINVPELVEIGKKIVNQCSNVPLMIKVVGSLLFGQEKCKWQAFEELGLAKTTRGYNEIMSVLRLSYDNLESQLKSCFSYCAVFPKDYEINKQMLIHLWMAQGYIKPFYLGQSMEEAGKEHFSILLRRCFFQDVEMNDLGDVVSCKIHDLMHDVAQEVAGMEICMASTVRNNMCDHKVRHLFQDERRNEEDSCPNRKIRSYLGVDWSCYNELIANCVYLRSLSLDGILTRNLPDSIGKLLHLRYLNLNLLYVETLPNSLTKLHNLQTLILAYSNWLRELPKDLSKLVNLRHLDIQGCQNLTYMPASMERLTSLAVLTNFIVADGKSSAKKCCHGQLKELKALKNLEGAIGIHIPAVFTNDEEGGYLGGLELLKCVRLLFLDASGERNILIDETIIRELRPHSNVQLVKLFGYHGRTIPRWGRAEDNWATFLPNLVCLSIGSCSKLRQLPLLSELRHLKSLSLKDLSDLEYIEEDITSSSSSYGVGTTSSRLISEVPFFPSLEDLVIEGIDKLKGWRKRRGEIVASFPRLQVLKIKFCPNLLSFPSCPSIEKLDLRHCNSERLRLTTTSDSILKKISVGHVADLHAVPACHPTSITISRDDDVHVEDFKGVGEAVNTHSFCSLANLEIEHFCELKTLSGGGFHHFTALESLCIFKCRKLSLNDDDDGDGIPWRSLHRTLSSLTLTCLDNMKNLPKGMQYLTSLKSLTIHNCPLLQAIPEWISCLSSLRSLEMGHRLNIVEIPVAMQNVTSLRKLRMIPCSEVLDQRCRDPDGQDWPKIRHIPDVSISSKW